MRVMLKSAMIPAVSQVMQFTGEFHTSCFFYWILTDNYKCWGNAKDSWSSFICFSESTEIFECVSIFTHQFSDVCFVRSTETINDGEFHTVELVTFDQMVNLSIDGGRPTTMDSFGKVQPLRGETPLYVGGSDAPQILTSSQYSQSHLLIHKWSRFKCECCRHFTVHCPKNNLIISL